MKPGVSHLILTSKLAKQQMCGVVWVFFIFFIFLKHKYDNALIFSAYMSKLSVQGCPHTQHSQVCYNFNLLVKNMKLFKYKSSQTTTQKDLAEHQKSLHYAWGLLVRCLAPYCCILYRAQRKYIGSHVRFTK